MTSQLRVPEPNTVWIHKASKEKVHILLNANVSDERKKPESFPVAPATVVFLSDWGIAALPVDGFLREFYPVSWGN